MVGRSIPSTVSLPHFQAELLVAEQGPLHIQFGKQQTCFFHVRGLQAPITTTTWGHFLSTAFPDLSTWKTSAKPTTKVIEELKWMHQTMPDHVQHGCKSGNRKSFQANCLVRYPIHRRSPFPDELLGGKAFGRCSLQP